MTSIRVPAALLAKLHQCAPPGVPLAAVIDAALAAAGGAEALQGRLAAAQRAAIGRTRVARLRMLGHRSVYLDEGQQVALADACGQWVRSLEACGDRRFDPQRRTLHLGGAATRGATGTRSRIRLSRRGAPL